MELNWTIAGDIFSPFFIFWHIIESALLRNVALFTLGIQVSNCMANCLQNDGRHHFRVPTKALQCYYEHFKYRFELHRSIALAQILHEAHIWKPGSPTDFSRYLKIKQKQFCEAAFEMAVFPTECNSSAIEMLKHFALPLSGVQHFVWLWCRCAVILSDGKDGCFRSCST